MGTDLSQLKRRRDKVQTELVAGRVDTETKGKLDKITDSEGISISALIYKLILDFVADYKPKTEGK